jgi:hypothetical protein
MLVPDFPFEQDATEFEWFGQGEASLSCGNHYDCTE